ncbi:MAG: gliding motility protein GldN [Paludibacteraceae bacterium]
MKKFSIIACFLLGITAVRAQHQVNSFFDEMGMAKIQTMEYLGTHDTTVAVEHRMDDVIWSRVIYRVIDMRYKQNYQLYFPMKSDDPNYRNLLLVIADAVVDGMPIYERNRYSIKPDDFKVTFPLSKQEIPRKFLMEKASDDPHDNNIAESNIMLINYDSVNDLIWVKRKSFESLAKNQLKYLIQEVVFFNKHTSRLHSKIVAIAPLCPNMIQNQNDVMEALHQSIMFWIPFDVLRPYMAKQYIIPSQNETKRVTFDDFFQKRLYTSYIVGEGNMYNRFIPDYSMTEGDIKKEQARIENELLTFEQDLWEY